MQTEPFDAEIGSAHGQVLPPVPPDEWQRVEQAYREIQRRDSSAEHQSWRWAQWAWGILGVWLVTFGVMVWQSVDHRKVQAFVQVVQVDEKGQLVQVGIPQDLLAYAPADGLWMDMLGEWVRRVRWRSADATLAKAQWAWVYRHTCGQARRLLQAIEEQDKPFEEKKKKLSSVDLKSITKTPIPESYQILWSETSIDASNPTVKTALWTGTFSVGRYRPPTMADTLDNRLGLCVTAFDLSQQP